MKEKKGFFLRWPWNVVVYVLLFLALRLFAVPVILLLMGMQQRNNPNGVAEGYCLSRTRKRLTWLIWALLVLLGAAGLLCMLYVGLQQDRAYWDAADYATLAFCGAGGPLLLVGGLYLSYAAIRDACFPGKSSLAKSIRGQLPYPEEAPEVEALFAMVDEDLKENGRWFGPVGIGQEWVLGDGANRIDRVRGIFVINEIHRHQTQTGTRTSRNMELVLVDDRWRRTGTSFRNLRDLQAAADCLALRVPEARRGGGSQCSAFLAMDEEDRETFERDFRRKRQTGEAARRQRESGIPQDMILKAGDEVTSRVDGEAVEEHLGRCLRGEEAGFTLTPTRPIEGGGQTFRALRTSAQGETVRLILELAVKPGEENLGMARELESREALTVLMGWLRREVPDLENWDLRRVYGEGPQKSPAAPSRSPQARLSLVYASGAAENHTTFTEEDVQLAAEGLVSGEYQLVDLTHPAGYLWIRVTAGSREDGRCTVEATRPEGEELGFYISKMSPREAAAWLTGYPHGQYLPGGQGWKRVRKPS